MGHEVVIKVRVQPDEELVDNDSNTHTVISGEVGKRLGGTALSVSPNAYIGTGALQGYENGVPWYREAIDSTDTQYLSAEQSASVIFIRNTGRTYSTSSALGVGLNKALKIMFGTTLITTLNSGEPWYTKDNNAGINPYNLHIRTVNLDGSNNTGAGHLAVEFFIAHVRDGTEFGIDQTVMQEIGV